MAQAVAVESVKVKRGMGEIPLIIRIIWFFVLGWELTGIWILAQLARSAKKEASEIAQS